MRVDIEPYPINPEIKYILLHVDNFQLGADDGWVSVIEYDKNDKFLNMTRVYLPHEVYSEWACDDDYIVEYCMDYLGFKRKKEIYLHFL